MIRILLVITLSYKVNNFIFKIENENDGEL